MNFTRAILGVGLVASFLCFIRPAAGENYPVVLHGKVIMSDGSPPPKTVGIERVCSDGYGSAPGPLTDKKGEFIWRMDVDPMRSRACVLRVASRGEYASTSIDISALNGYLNTNITLEPIVLTILTDDPYVINIPESRAPGRARSKLKAAMKAIEAKDYAEAVRQFQAAVEAGPKFAPAWHGLGVLLDRANRLKEAREAFEHAIESDPKLLPPYVTLTHLCIKTKDWECAAKTADALIQVDNKHKYPEIYLHRAVAEYQLHDLDKALESAQEAIRLDPGHGMPRAEYVYGRILEAKGDIAGAREHMSRYLELDKNAPDPEVIRQHMQNLGKPGTEPELEYP